MIKKIVVFIAFLITMQSFAQKTNGSPYSFFGIGSDVSPKTVEELSMGGIGTAFSEWNSLSFGNPASSANLRLTSFSIAGRTNSFQLKDKYDKQQSSSTTLSYIVLGFPISKNSGLLLGMQPNTTVGYSMVDKDLDGNGDIEKETYYNGNGGTNRMFFNFGYRFFDKLNFGIGGDFYFGNVENNIIEQIEDVQLATKHKEKNFVKGGTAQFGVQYKDSISKKLVLNVGATIKLDYDLNVEGDQYLYSTVYLNGAESPRDTILSAPLKGKYINPMIFSGGVGIGQPNKWYVGVNYTFQDAISYEGNNITTNANASFEPSSMLSVGGFYLPRINSISSYWERITYRAGFKMEKTGLQIDRTSFGGEVISVDDFGMSFGVGLPIGKNISKLNLGFDFGRKGTTSGGLVQEDYFNVRLGLSLNDRWFRKRKIN